MEESVRRSDGCILLLNNSIEVSTDKNKERLLSEEKRDEVKKAEQLWDKEKQLRDKKKQLRDEKKQLRDEARQRLDEEIDIGQNIQHHTCK